MNVTKTRTEINKNICITMMMIITIFKKYRKTKYL